MSTSIGFFVSSDDGTAWLSLQANVRFVVGQGSPRTIWPDSFQKVLPSDAKYHEQKIGGFVTFESNIPGPSKWERVGTGSLQKRRPRNTCVKCNTGWMSKIEEAALPAIRSLLIGERLF